MEVSLSPEEYFRQHAASLLHSGEDSADDGNNSNSKEAWSDIDDNSATEDDEAVIKRKRILRHGRKRLSEMRERFNASKKRLFEARKQQLDLEMSQLKSGTHPQYKEFMEQVDARWTGRLEKIKQKMDCNRDVAQLKLESSQRSARNTYIASRGELRRAMILRRKKQMWGLADDLRNLERIREAIIGIACPLSNAAGPVEPVKGSAAPAHSSHLLSLPDTHLSKVDEDADVSAICGIPALLNYSESDLVDTEDSGQTLISTAADGMDIRVPGSRPGYASQIGDEAGSAAYGDGYQGAEEGVASNGDITGAATMAAAAAGYEAASASQDYRKAYADHRTISDASHMAYNASMSHQESMTATANSSAPAVATATSANANMHGAAAPTAIYHSSSTAAANQPADSYGEPYEKHYYANGDYAAASSSAKVADLAHNAAAEPGAAAYAYGSSRKQQQHAHINGHAEDHRMAGYSDVQGGHGIKREMPVVDYEGSASGKRHRVVQPSATWSEPSHYQQPQPQQYPSYQGAQEWQEAPVAGASGKPRYHPAEADPAMASYAYDRNDYYNKHHVSVNETGAAGSYRPQYSPPQPAEQPLSQPQAQQQQQQPYHYNQQQVQDYRRPGVSSGTYYGGAQKYEYAQEPSAYYHQQANPYHGQDSGYYQGSSHYAHPHSGSAVATAGARQTEGYYQSSHHQYGQQQQRQAAGSYAGQVANDYQQQQQQQQHQYASNSSYSGLDTGISMPAPSSSSAWGDYYSQQQQQQHYQGSHGYRQQPHAYDSRGRDPNGYYANGSQPPPPQTHAMHPGNAAAATATATATTYHRRQVTTTGGGGEPLHYPSSLANALK